MLEAFNRKMELYISAGLIDFWQFQALDKRVLKKESEERKPLAIVTLMGCFQVLFIGLGLSLFMFMLELLSTACECSLIKMCLIKCAR